METIGNIGSAVYSICGAVVLFFVGMLAIRFNFKGLRYSEKVQENPDYVKRTDTCFLWLVVFVVLVVIILAVVFLG